MADEVPQQEQMEHVILENEDVKTELVDVNSSEPKKFSIALCDDHQQDLLFALSSVKSCNQQNLMRASHALFSLAARTIGTIDLVKHRCPVCALQRFEYVKGIVSAVLKPPTGAQNGQPPKH